MSRHDTRPLLPLPLAAGAVAGALLFRERYVRCSAERFAAAALETLLNAIDANDAETGKHVRRVARYALILGEAAGLAARECRNVERVALFHDVGKIHQALFDIVHDGDTLTPSERRQIATHPARGVQVLAPLAAFYPDLAEGVLSHHERWDGGGYPRHLAGPQIPLSARVVSIADTFDAVTHRRRYRGPRGTRTGANVIAAGAGTQFDPDLVSLFLLPPVLERVQQAMGESQAPRLRGSERRAGRREPSPPDITFRWRR